ncbi:MAG: prolyl oligopeptidase family serine peptidase [Chloroherpetonaceae bacterium]
MLLKRLLTRTLLLFVLAGVSFSLCAQQEYSRFKTDFFEHRGLKIPYRFFTPAVTSSQKTYPLVLYLHGAGERGNDASNLVLKNGAWEFAKRQTQYPCYVLVPQCPKEMKWSPYQKELGYYRLSDTASLIQELLIELLNDVQRRYLVDTSRVYVVGISMGGFGTWELVMRNPSRFAAAVPICGGGDVTQVRRIQHLPIWVFHGTDDQVIPVHWSRTLVDSLKALGSPVQYTEFPNVGHNAWSPAFANEALYEWLFSQKKP